MDLRDERIRARPPLLASPVGHRQSQLGFAPYECYAGSRRSLTPPACAVANSLLAARRGAIGMGGARVKESARRRVVTARAESDGQILSGSSFARRQGPFGTWGPHLPSEVSTQLKPHGWHCLLCLAIAICRQRGRSLKQIGGDPCPLGQAQPLTAAQGPQEVDARAPGSRIPWRSPQWLRGKKGAEHCTLGWPQLTRERKRYSHKTTYEYPHVRGSNKRAIVALALLSGRVTSRQAIRTDSQSRSTCHSATTRFVIQRERLGCE